MCLVVTVIVCVLLWHSAGDVNPPPADFLIMALSSERVRMAKAGQVVSVSHRRSPPAVTMNLVFQTSHSLPFHLRVHHGCKSLAITSTFQTTK